MDQGEQVPEATRAAAQAFFEATMPGLVNGLTVYIGERALAEELAQEAMLRAFRRWEHVATLDVPEAWVWRVAVNLAKSRFRRRRIACRVQLKLEASAVDPTHVEDGSWTVALQDAVMALPARQRLAMVLRYYLDLSVADTAARMDATADAVRSLTKRGVASLRTEFQAAPLSEGDGDG
jgi:RNA polymerase sigma-70 factor (ECF subfamily)